MPDTSAAPLVLHKPQIHDLMGLFTGPRSEPDNWGFPEGSSILLSGEPGTGKSFFALAMARGVWFSKTLEPTSQNQPKESCVLYLISAEHDHGRLYRDFSRTGWFDEDDPIFKNWDKSKAANFIHISARVELNRPVPTSEELINRLLTELRDRHSVRMPGTKAIVVVDSLTALLRDCGTAGEERRQTHEFITRLEAALGKETLALTFFLSEQPRTWTPIAGVEEYVVDFVFRLQLEKSAGGRRLRVLEVVKSHGVSLHLGRHTWSMVYRDTAGSVLTQARMIDEVGCMAVGEKTKDLSARIKWATIVIFSQGRLRYIGDQQRGILHENGRAEERLASGIPGLDQMLDFWPAGRDYWVRRELGMTDATPHKGLKPGTITVLVGPAGAGKTTMCLQFLMGDADAAHKSLYINFESPWQEVIRHFPGQQQIDSIHRIYRRRGNLDVGALLTEIRYCCARNSIFRIAIDGLSSLLATSTKEEYAQLIERIIGTIRDQKVDEQAITLFITYEPEARGAGEEADVPRLSALADNLIVVNDVRIEDEVRHAVYLAKARGMNHDRTVREIRATDDPEHPIGIFPGLESYTELLGKRPKPVSLALQLFYENEFEETYNRALEKQLGSVFNYEVKVFGYSRAAISRTLRELASTEIRFPASHVRVLTLDEWVVREFEVNVRWDEIARANSAIETLATSKTAFAALKNQNGGLLKDAAIWEPISNQFQVAENAVNTYKKEVLVQAYRHDVMAKNRKCRLQVAGVLTNKSKLTGEEWNTLKSLKLKNETHDLHTFLKKAVIGLRTTQANIEKRNRNESWFINAWNVLGVAARALETLTQTPDVPLLPLSPFLRLPKAAPDQCPLTTHASDFFSWELEKGMAGNSKRTLVALPLYVDFGMFCVNAKLLNLMEFEGPRPGGGATSRNEHVTETIASRTTSKEWLNVVRTIPRYWATTDRSQCWFKKPDPNATNPTLVDWMKFVVMEPNKIGSQWGFVFDIATEETAGNFFLELCWAFGASSRLFSESEKAAKTKNKEATKWAMRFIMFLVAERLMPSNPSINQSSEALFSRHFYSTFCDCMKPRKVHPANSMSDHTQVAGLAESKRADLLLVPFMPAVNSTFVPSLEFDNAERLANALRLGLLQKSVFPYGANWNDFVNRHSSLNLKNIPKGFSETDDAKRDIIPDFRDELAFLERHRLRDDLMNGNGDIATDGKPFKTGYCCTGSWMVSVHGHTHSAGLSCKLIDEMTSLESVAERARMGAGIPARKDFYQFFGDEEVTNAPYLTWSDLLCYCGARSRMRQDAVDPIAGRVRRMNEILHQRIQAAICYAHILSKTGGSDDYDSGKLVGIADQFVEEIFAGLENDVLM